LIPVLSVIAVIIVLVVAHELGHFLAAKATGMRVEEFAVGFGTKKLTLLTRGGTEYNLRPIPAGGFVRIAGMDPGEESPPDGFNAQSVWKRMLVIFAGPLASFVFAYVLFCSLGMTVGLPLGGPKAEVSNVIAGTPAAEMGLKAGDQIVSIAGKPIRTGEEMMKAIEANPGKRVPVVVNRENNSVTLYGTPRPTEIPDPKGGGKTLTVGKLGFNPSPSLKRVGFVESIEKGTILSYNMVKQLLSVVFSKRIAKEAGGPIAIINATHQAAESGIAHLVILTAGLSLNFAVLNLLPIPVLDGGHILLLLVEVARGRKLSARAQNAALTFGLAVLAVIIVLVLAKDITSLLPMAR